MGSVWAAAGSSVVPMAAQNFPRTLAELLRGWSDDQVSHLLASRPDLTTGAPHDSAALASRAGTRSSVLRALEGLDRLELSVLDALVVCGQASRQQLHNIVHADSALIDAALSRLESVLLVWETDEGLRPLSGVAEALRGGPEEGVSGVQPVSSHAPDPETLAAHLAALSPAARAMLTHVVGAGGQATTGPVRRGSPAEAVTPAEELVSRGLLRLLGAGSAVVPGEVALLLRGGHTTEAPLPTCPSIATSTRELDLVERAAAGAAFETMRRVELLLDTWGQRPPAVLRSGGLGVRELKAAAHLLHVSESTAALVVEVARSAGLLAQGVTGDGDPAWLPTDAYDRWADLAPAPRWARLVTAWIDDVRVPALIGSKDAAGRTRNCLTPELSWPLAPETRRMVLSRLAGLAPGECLATGTGVPSLVARVRWERPRRPSSRDQLVAWTVDEASTLGLLGLGGATTALRALVAGEDPTPAIARHLPEPVDHVLLQADLTAVAPGPLVGDLARTLHLVADVESRGGATVYRFTPTSIRRAFDAGWGAADLHDLLAKASRTPVPQALQYLVDDVARTFGSIRVGYAEAFLRSEDEVALTELLHHPAAVGLGLRRLAPTVLISTVSLEVLLPRLREIGTAPVVEGPDGVVRVARPDVLRARTPRPDRSPAVHRAKEAAHVAAVLSAVRAGDRAAAAAPTRSATRTTPADALGALREAVESRATVLIGYTDNQGQVTERLVEPTRVEGGQLSAWDQRSHKVRNFAVHRITAVTVQDQPAPPSS